MCCAVWGQVPAKWVGSGATIALVPKTCLIYPDQKTLACSPARLVLTKSAGGHTRAPNHVRVQSAYPTVLQQNKRSSPNAMVMCDIKQSAQTVCCIPNLHC